MRTLFLTAHPAPIKLSSYRPPTLWPPCPTWVRGLTVILAAGETKGPREAMNPQKPVPMAPAFVDTPLIASAPPGHDFSAWPNFSLSSLGPHGLRDHRLLGAPGCAPCRALP